MMVSDWIAMWQHLLSINLGVLAIILFGAVAVAVTAYRIASNMDGPLVLSGTFTAAFMLAALVIEKGDEPMWIGIFSMVLVGVGRAAYLRLLAR